jgi:hypothetical protein
MVVFQGSRDWRERILELLKCVRAAQWRGQARAAEVSVGGIS